MSTNPDNPDNTAPGLDDAARERMRTTKPRHVYRARVEDLSQTSMPADDEHTVADEAYKRASWAYEDAVKTNMPQAVRDAAEQNLIAATLTLTQATTNKNQQLKEAKMIRDPKWGTTGGPDYPRHGEIQTYTNKKCRCDKCRDTWKNYCRDLHDTRPDRLEIPHGTTNGHHNYGCRCDLCVDAHLTEYRERHSALKHLSRMRNRGEAAI